MIIDANDLVVGRLASFVAKNALLGEKIDIVNSEKAVVIGSPKNILANYKQLRARGDAMYGPYFPRTPERILKRTIRGMLPHKHTRGKDAFKSIKCYKGIPARFQDQSTSTIEKAKRTADKLKFMSLQRISELL